MLLTSEILKPKSLSLWTSKKREPIWSSPDCNFSSTLLQL